MLLLPTNVRLQMMCITGVMSQECVAPDWLAGSTARQRVRLPSGDRLRPLVRPYHLVSYPIRNKLGRGTVEYVMYGSIIRELSIGPSRLKASESIVLGGNKGVNSPSELHGVPFVGELGVLECC
jgi:hypothetical protein